jgi:hypothetical protein
VGLAQTEAGETVLQLGIGQTTFFATPGTRRKN